MATIIALRPRSGNEPVERSRDEVGSAEMGDARCLSPRDPCGFTSRQSWRLF